MTKISDATTLTPTEGDFVPVARTGNSGAFKADLVAATQANSLDQVLIKKITPADPYEETFGPFIIDVDNTVWPSGGPYTSADPILCIGYNTAAGGTRPVAGERSFGWRIEANYLAPTETILESYWEYTSDDAVVSFRPIHFTVNVATQENVMYLRSDRVEFAAPSKVAPGSGLAVAYFNASPQLFTMYGASGVISGFAVNAGDTNGGAYMQLGYNNVQNAFRIQTLGANDVSFIQNGSYSVKLRDSVGGISAPSLYIGATAPADAHIVVTPTNTAIGCFEAIAAGSQAASLYLAKVGSAYPWRITKSGYCLIGTVAAPADAEVLTSTALFWFDNTNGAGKLMVKAKTADGTVVTGSVSLA